MSMTDKRDPREPRNIPPELLAVWRKHRKLADKYEEEHNSWGYGEKYYNLMRKHERVCDAIDSINARAHDHQELAALKSRVESLPCDPDKSGSLTHVMEAVRKLKSDMAIGNL